MLVRMRNGLAALTALAMTLALAGCGESMSGDGVGGVSASEAQALNEAAEMLDARTSATVELNSNATPSAAKPE